MWMLSSAKVLEVGTKKGSFLRTRYRLRCKGTAYISPVQQ